MISRHFLRKICHFVSKMAKQAFEILDLGIAVKICSHSCCDHEGQAF